MPQFRNTSLFFILLSISLLSQLTACGGGSGSTSTDNQTPNNQVENNGNWDEGNWNEFNWQ